MGSNRYRYTFAAAVPMDEVEATLLLAVLATESLHGETQTRLDVGHAFDPDRRTCVIDATPPAGRDFNRLFVGFVTREFGPDGFRVERLPAAEPMAV